jgi:lycopene cyclase domain-containing protein
MFGHYSYLLSTLIFAGGAIIIEFALAYDRLKRHIRIIGLMILLVLIYTPITETVAFHNHVWAYSPNKTFHYHFLGAEIESYLFTVLTTVAVTCAVLIWLEYEDNKQPIIKQTLGNLKHGESAIWHKKHKK